MHNVVLDIGKLDGLVCCNKISLYQREMPLEIAGTEMIPLWFVNRFDLASAVNPVFRKCYGFTHIDA